MKQLDNFRTFLFIITILILSEYNGWYKLFVFTLLFGLVICLRVIYKKNKLLEDPDDALIIEQRKNEPRESIDFVKEKLLHSGKLK